MSLLRTALLSLLLPTVAAAEVKLLRTPDRGIQPQAIRDAKGVLHLLYLKGDPAAGDLFYLRQDPGSDRFSAPIKVNATPGAAVATGSVRGGQMALGKDGRVHVVWFGSRSVPSKDGAAMLYTRLNDKGTAFEKERDMRHHTAFLDGGGTVAADQAGNVYVAWHSVPTGIKGETERCVWLSVSRDEGKTFSDEKPAWDSKTGACGCCGMRGFADGKNVYFLYRSAVAGEDRDIYLLASNDEGKRFSGARVHPWKTTTCPMSTLSFARGPDAVVAAWDTEGEVFFSRLKNGVAEHGTPQTPPRAGKGGKHPALAFNGKGEMILVWAEGTGWNRGGALAWQVYDKAGKATAERGRRDGGIPVWGLPTVVGTEDGFLIMH